MPPSNRRPCAIDTSRHFCPHAGCDSQGGPGLGNRRATGYPSGGLWRQYYCRSCQGYFLEANGTIFHGKRLSVALIVRVLACLAAGLGIRATARVFEVAPTTVLQWLVAAAEQLQAFTRYLLCDVHVDQLQLDELSAVLRGVKEGEVNEDDAILPLEGARPWAWTAIDPVRTLLLAMEVGPRPVAMAQRVGHQVVRVVAPGYVPAWFSDGCTGYLPAILGHCGWGVPPRAARTKTRGPSPAGCRGRGCSMRRSSSSPGVSAGRGGAPGGMRHERGDCTGPSCLGLVDQYRFCREAQSGPPPAGSGDRTPGQHAVPGRGQHAASTGGVPRLRQFRVASCELTPAVAGSRAPPRHGISEVVAAAHASDGGRTH